MKKLTLLIASILPITVFAHYPDPLLCEPQQQVTCNAEFTLLKEGRVNCSQNDLRDKEFFSLKVSKDSQGSPAYIMSSSWIDYPMVVLPEVILIDLDRGSETSQLRERTYFAPKLGGLTENQMFDQDFTGLATLSGTGHPHSLQFILAHDGPAGTITQISYAFCSP